MTDKLEKLFKHTAGFAADTFKAQGELMPMWVAEDSKGDKTLIATPFGSDDEKDVTAVAVRKIFKDVGAVRCAFISEAWTLGSDANGKLPKGYKRGDPISEHPLRREVLVITAEDHVGASIMGLYPILRPDGGKPTLGPLEGDSKICVGGGRFTNLLLPELVKE